MTTDQDTEIEMPISYVGDDRDDPDAMIFLINISGRNYWFIGRQQYKADGSRFAMEIGFFGYSEKDLVGSSGDAFRHRFPANLKSQFEDRLRSFFLGDENKPFFPFTHPKARCVGVTFQQDWILTR